MRSTFDDFDTFQTKIGLLFRNLQWEMTRCCDAFQLFKSTEKDILFIKSSDMTSAMLALEWDLYEN